MGIQVSGHNDLKPLAPYTLSELHANLLGKLRGNVLLLEAEITVISLYAILLAILLLDHHKLFSCLGGVAVDTLHIEFPLGFFFVLRVRENISERLILLIGIIFLFCLVGIRSIIKHPLQRIADGPDFAYCHFTSLFSG